MSFRKKADNCRLSGKKIGDTKKSCKYTDIICIQKDPYQVSTGIEFNFEFLCSFRLSYAGKIETEMILAAFTTTSVLLVLNTVVS